MRSLLTEEHLKELVHQKGITQQEQVLLCLAVDLNKPKQIKEIREIAVRAGLRAAKKWNLADILLKSNGKAIKTLTGWELRGEGRQIIEQLAGAYVSAPSRVVATSLRAQITKIKSPSTQAFVQEAIVCFESELYRAAVVLSWVGAVSVLYAYVLNHKLPEFNAEATKRNSKWKTAKSIDDLAELAEYDFLQVIHAVSIIGKSVKQQLEGCLKLRNGCGHPNSLVIGDNTAASHIETLLLNVFVPFVT